MESQNKDLIKEIRDRIQFLVTAEIFFSTIIYTFYKIIGSDEILANNNTIFWGIGVAFCIINYLIIGFTKKATTRMLGWIRYAVSLNIGLFILPMILIALIIREPVSEYYKWPFIISFTGSIWMPIITFFLIIVVIIQTNGPWIRKIFKKFCVLTK